jgi:histidine triad (HIT) family protein
MSCLFCKIVSGEIPSTPVYQDELAYAFADISPKAPVHVLVVPKEHLDSVHVAGQQHEALLGHLMAVAAEIARSEEGGQTVDHLHLHLLGGRPMTWPPG